MAKSFQDRLNKRRSSSFVGREQEIELFRHNLTLSPADDNYYFIFNIYGQGGVGKTTLVRKFQDMAKEQKMLTVYTDESIKGTLEFMEDVAKQLSAQDVKLKKFEERYKKYLEEKEKLEKSPDAPKGGFWSLIARTGTKIGMHYAKKAIGEDALKEMIDTDAVAGQATEWMDYIHKHITNKDERQLILEPEAVLTPLLLEDLNVHCEKHRLCWLIDTYEDTAQFLDNWLRFLLDGKYGNTPENLLFVIAGRETLDANAWSSFHAVTRSFSIESFTKEEALRFLNDRQITNPQVVEDLMELTMCLPVLLSMLADTAPTSADTPTDISGTAVKRFLRWINNPVLERVALYAALPRQLNQDILAALLEDGEDPVHYFSWLKDRPFVHKRGNYWAYHNVVHDLMLRHQYHLSQDTWCSLHLRLAAFYEKRAEALGITERELQFSNDEWLAYALEIAYHRLSAAYSKELPKVVADFATICRLSDFKKAIPWSETIYQVGKIQENTEIGALLCNGVMALISEEWAAALPMISKINMSLKLNNSEDISFFFWEEGFLENECSNHQKAIECYQRAIEIKTDNYAARNNMGLVYYSLEQNQKAIECYGKAIEFNPNKYEAWYNMGLAYSKLEQKQRAIACYEKAIEIKLDSDEVWYCMGNACCSLEQNERAIACYEKAIEINLNKHEAWNNMGTAHSSLGQSERAIECYEKAVGAKPDDHWAWNNMGVAYSDLGQKEKAIECYEKAVGIKSDYHEAWYNMGNAYSDLGQKENAIECYEKSVDVKPDKHEAWYNMGNAYSDLGQKEKAIKYYEKAVEIKPDRHGTWNDLGYLYFQLSKIEESIHSFEKAAEYGGITDFTPKFNIAFLKLRQGKLEESKNLSESIWRDSGMKEPFAAKNLGHYFLFSKDSEKALEWYRISLPLWEGEDENLFGHLETDYENLLMSSHGITREAYDAIIAQLREVER